MSRTIREVQPGWGPTSPEWTRMQAHWDSIGKFPYKGEKYRLRDRSGFASRNSRNHRFSKHVRNTRHNLLRKNEVISHREHLAILG